MGKKTENKSPRRYARINGTDIFILVLVCLTVLGVVFRGVILERIRSMAVKDTVYITVRSDMLDSDVEKMIDENSALYENGVYFGTFTEKTETEPSEEYILTDGDMISLPVEGAIDMTGTVRLEGVKTDDGFLLPSGRIVRKNDKVTLSGKGFVFDAVIIDIYAE